ncbi:MAG: hypothetical protein RR539_10140 [Clostridium sp.]|uniref:hypothetical protein n=1 Tax=Clostridium sp. TaxID=1506 RepID=UPI002FC70C6D
MKSKKLVGASLVGVMALSSGTSLVSSIEEINVAEASSKKLESEVTRKVNQLGASLKKNYLGLKNVGQWQAYIKDAKKLISRLPNGKIKNEFVTKVNRAEALVKAAAGINKVEQSMKINANVMKNVEQWQNYIGIAKEDMKKIDMGEFGKQYNELLQRASESTKLIGVIETKYKESFKKVEDLVVEAEKLMATNKEDAKKKLEEAKVLADKLQSHSSKNDILNKINGVISGIPVKPEVKPEPPTSNNNGNVVSKSKVSFQSTEGSDPLEDGFVSISNQNGIVSTTQISYLPAGTYNYVIYKPGCVRVTGTLTVNGISPYNKLVTLSRIINSANDLKEILPVDMKNRVVQTADSLKITGGEVTISKDITLNKSIVVDAGAKLNVNGDVAVNNINVTGEVGVSAGSTLVTTGEVVNTGIIYNSGEITIKAGATFNNEGTVTTGGVRRAVNSSKLVVEDGGKINIKNNSKLVFSSMEDMLLGNNKIDIYEGSTIVIGNKTYIGGAEALVSIASNTSNNNPVGGWTLNGDKVPVLYVSGIATVNESIPFDINMILNSRESSEGGVAKFKSFKNFQNGSGVFVEAGGVLELDNKVHVGYNGLIENSKVSVQDGNNYYYDYRACVNIRNMNNTIKHIFSGRVKTKKEFEDSEFAKNVLLEAKSPFGVFKEELLAEWYKSDGTGEVKGNDTTGPIIQWYSIDSKDYTDNKLVANDTIKILFNEYVQGNVADIQANMDKTFGEGVVEVGMVNSTLMFLTVKEGKEIDITAKKDYVFDLSCFKDLSNNKGQTVTMGMKDEYQHPESDFRPTNNLGKVGENYEHEFIWFSPKGTGTESKFSQTIDGRKYYSDGVYLSMAVEIDDANGISSKVPFSEVFDDVSIQFENGQTVSLKGEGSTGNAEWRGEKGEIYALANPIITKQVFYGLKADSNGKPIGIGMTSGEQLKGKLIFKIKESVTSRVCVQQAVWKANENIANFSSSVLVLDNKK